MANNVDIIDVMIAVHRGELKVVIQNGFFLLENTRSGERVRLNETDAVPVVHGYWFLTEHEYLNCSVCGKPYYTGIETLSAALDHLEYAGGHKFCPNCGAKMDLKEGDHETG